MDENEASVEELIQIELAMIEAVIEAVGEPVSRHQEHRKRTSELLSRLRSGAIAPEYAEIELQKLQEKLVKQEAEEDRRFSEE